jgi:hypothetical protein
MPLYLPPAPGGGGYSTVRTRDQRFIIQRSSAGTSRTLRSPTNVPLSVGDSITVNIGNASYDGTFTLTAVSGGDVTYTAGSSLTEAATPAGGVFGWTLASPARSDLVIYGPGAAASDVGGRTQIVAQGNTPTPLSGQLMGPLATGLIDNSFTDYQVAKYVPIYVPESGITFTTIRARVTASSSVGVIRFGVYGANFAGDPGNLIQDFGTTNIIGFGIPLPHSRTISWTPAEAGVYYLCAVFQNSSAGAPGMSEGTLLPRTHLTGGYPLVQTFQGTGITGALPVSAGAGPPTNPDRVPLVLLIR